MLSALHRGPLTFYRAHSHSKELEGKNGTLRQAFVFHGIITRRSRMDYPTDAVSGRCIQSRRRDRHAE